MAHALVPVALLTPRQCFGATRCRWEPSMLRCLLIALIPVVLSIPPALAIGLEVRGDSVIRGSSGGGHTSAARLRVEVPAMPASKVADQFGQTITKQKRVV